MKPKFRFDSRTDAQVQAAAAANEIRIDDRTLSAMGLTRNDELVPARLLTFVDQDRMRLYTPQLFRSILPVTSRVPEWVETIAMGEIEILGQFKPLNMLSKNFTTSNLNRLEATQRVVTYGGGYRFSDMDLLRSMQMQMPLDSALAAGNDRLVEIMLDDFAATGVPAINSLGLGNWAGIATVVAVAKTGGGLLWTGVGALASEIALDVANLIMASYINSRQNYDPREGGIIAMPASKYQALQGKIITGTSKTLLDQMQETYPKIKFLAWEKLVGLGAGATDRVVCMPLNEAVARFEIPGPLTNRPMIREAFGVAVPQTVTVAGTIVETPSAVVFMDAV